MCMDLLLSISSKLTTMELKVIFMAGEILNLMSYAYFVAFLFVHP